MAREPSNPLHLDPEKTRIHLLPRHVVVLVATMAVSVGYAYDLKGDVARLGLRLDGLGDAPGLASRVKEIETSQADSAMALRSLELRVTQLQDQMSAQENIESQDRRRIAEVLSKIEEQLKKGRDRR